MGLERFRARDGLSLAFRRLGQGRRLICLPGGPGGSSAFFGDLAGIDAILLDPRGSGGSDRPDPPSYELDDYARDLEDLRDHLGVDELDLLGWSAGGFAAIVYASTFPERVRRLVLVGSFPRFSEELRANVTSAMEAQEQEDDPQRVDAVVARRERMSSPNLSDDEVARLFRRELAYLFGRFGDRERAFVERLRAELGFDFAALRYFNERVAPTFDLRPLLPSVVAPTLVLNGELDPSNAGEQELLAGIPDSRCVRLADAGHVPWVEAPERFRAAVVEFLER